MVRVAIGLCIINLDYQLNKTILLGERDKKEGKMEVKIRDRSVVQDFFEFL